MSRFQLETAKWLIDEGNANQRNRPQPTAPDIGPPITPPPLVLVNITDKYTSKGVYKGKLCLGGLAAATTSDFTLPDTLDVSAADDCIVYSLTDYADGGKHSIAIDGSVYLIGMVVGARDGKTCVVVAQTSSLRIVYLDQVGGADGDGTTAATWTYDVYGDPELTIPITTAATQLVPRVIPSECTPADYGLGAILDGSFQLIYAFESFPMADCGA